MWFSPCENSFWDWVNSMWCCLRHFHGKMAWSLHILEQKRAYRSSLKIKLSQEKDMKKLRTFVLVAIWIACIVYIAVHSYKVDYNHAGLASMRLLIPELERIKANTASYPESLKTISALQSTLHPRVWLFLPGPTFSYQSDGTNYNLYFHPFNFGSRYGYRSEDKHYYLE